MEAIDAGQCFNLTAPPRLFLLQFWSASLHVTTCNNQFATGDFHFSCHSFFLLLCIFCSSWPCLFSSVHGGSSIWFHTQCLLYPVYQVLGVYVRERDYLGQWQLLSLLVLSLFFDGWIKLSQLASCTGRGERSDEQRCCVSPLLRHLSLINSAWLLHVLIIETHQTIYLSLSSPADPCLLLFLSLVAS
jgi:hypothetical protein